MKIRDYFDWIPIISLASRLDRRRDVASELKRHELPLEPGKVEFFDGIRPENDGGFPSIGLHGCFLSHLEILRKARSAGFARILILEDDFQLSRKFDRSQESIVKQLQDQRWDIVYFGHLIPTGASPSPTFVPVDRELDILLTHAYAVNGAIFERLVSFLETLLTRPPGDPEGGPMSPDGALSTFRKRNPDVVTLIASPNLCWQRSSRTDNHALRWIDVVPVVRNVVGLGRRLKILIGSYR